MADVLLESGKRSNRLQLENTLRIFSASQNAENIKAMHDLCDEIIAERQSHPQPDSNDLLNAMLEGKDPQTGEKLSIENIRYNLVTFLVWHAFEHFGGGMTDKDRLLVTRRPAGR